MCSLKFYVIFLLLQERCCHGSQTGKTKSLTVDGTFHNFESKHPGVYRFGAGVTASVEDVSNPWTLILKCRLKVNVETDTAAFKHEEVTTWKYDKSAGNKISHNYTFSLANEYHEFVRDIKCTGQLHTNNSMGNPSVETIDLDDQHHAVEEKSDFSGTPEVAKKNEWTQWDAWTNCSVTCGGGSRTRIRSSQYATVQENQTEFCNDHSCLDEWTQWVAWSNCSETCGGGSRTRIRSKQNATVHDNQTESCNNHFCPDEWTQWGAWSNCSETCGGGSRTRIRSRQNATVHGNQTESCNNHFCPVNGNWADWTTIGNCEVTCNGDENASQETRTCTNPAPRNNGSQCNGDNIQGCRTENCLAPHGLLTAENFGVIQQWLNGNRFHLVYNSSDSGSSFFASVEDVSPTLVVGVDKDSGYLFGGYTAAVWKDGDTNTDGQAFIFKMSDECTTVHCATRITVHSGKVAISLKRSYPEFGDNDLPLNMGSTQECQKNNYGNSMVPSGGLQCSGDWKRFEVYKVI